MAYEILKNKPARVAYASVMVAGTVLLLPESAAASRENRGMENFRQFKQANHGTIRNRALRQMFRDQIGISKGHNAGLNNLAFQPALNPNAGQQASNNLHKHRDPSSTRFLTHTLQTNGSELVGTHSGMDIDLSSADRNITLGSKLFKNSPSITIELAGTTKELTAGSEVTAAEYVAAKQVLLGRQAVVIDGQGRAIGGQVDLSAITSRGDRMTVDDLNVPLGLTAYGDFGKRSSFELTGDLVNAGTIYALSSSKGVTRGTIRADNISNEASGLITSDLPDSHHLDSDVDLVLHANETLSNSGVISSSGELTLSAGESVKNNGPASVIQARNDLNVLAPQVVNQGAMKSLTGAINIDTPQGMLNVNNNGGSIEALNGAINLRNDGYNGIFDTFVNGGDLLSNSLNVHSGQGVADISVNQLTGTIHETGVASHIAASTETLSLGNICLTGDPTYKNDSGSISINGDITVGSALTIIASGSIFITTDVVITAGDGTTGYPITLIAGADITPLGSGDTTDLGPGPLPFGIQTTLTNQGSATGGDIAFGTSGFSATFNARSTAKTGNSKGGNILFAAFEQAGAGSAGGHIDMTGCVINCGGKGTGNNGDVLFLAEGSDTGTLSCITTGTINATGGSGSGGDIQIFARNIDTTTGANVTYNANGTLNGTEQLVPDSVVQNNAQVIVDGNLSAQNQIQIACGGSGTDVIQISDGVTISTKSSQGAIILQPLFASDLTQGTASLISTNTLSIFTTDGEIGSASNPIITNAKYVNITGSTTNTDVNIKDINPGLVILDNTTRSLKMVVTGSVMSASMSIIQAFGGLTLQSLTGNVGLSEANPIQTNSVLLTVNAAKDAFVHDNNIAGTVITGDCTAGGTFNLHTVGPTLAGSVGSSVFANKVALTADSTFNILNTPITGLTSVSLTCDGDILNSTVSSGGIITPLLILESLTGNIGMNVANRLNIFPGVKGLSLLAPMGSAFMSAPLGGKKGFNLGKVQVNGLLDFSAIGPVKVIDDVDANSVTILAATGALTTNPNVTISGVQSITLRVSDTTANALKSSKIIIGKGTHLETIAPGVLGTIIFAVGTIAGVAVEGTAPTGVSFAETNPGGANGNIFWGEKGIKAKPTNTLFAKGANIIFNNPLSSKNISLGGGGVQITADPPIAEGTVITWFNTGKNGSSKILTAPFASQSTDGATVGSTDQAHPSALYGGMPTTMSGIDRLRLYESPSVSLLPPDATISSVLQADSAQLLPGVPPTSTGGVNAVDEEDDSFMTSYASGSVMHDAAICAREELAFVCAPHRRLSGKTKVNLTGGHAVFMPDSDTTVTTAHGTVGIKAGAAVLVSSSNKGLAVFNLHDEKKGSVSVNSQGQAYSLSPGQHILMVSPGQRGSFAGVNTMAGISHRSLRTIEFDAETTAYASEFSIPSALSAVLPLKSILQSKDMVARKMSSRLIKTAAVLMQLSQSSEPYQHYLKPFATAMQQ